MGVSLERVQFKFASIIGELCSEPDVLSQFAVWVDLRLAEYKLKGSISLDCSGESPDPIWLKGIKSAIIEKALSMRSPKPTMRHKMMSRGSTPIGNRSPVLGRDKPMKPASSHTSSSILSDSVESRLADDNITVKQEPEEIYAHDVHPNNSESRKRQLTESGNSDMEIVQLSDDPSYVNAKQSRLEDTVKPENESLMSIIGMSETDDTLDVSQDQQESITREIDFLIAQNAAEKAKQITDQMLANPTHSPHPSTSSATKGSSNNGVVRVQGTPGDDPSNTLDRSSRCRIKTIQDWIAAMHQDTRLIYKIPAQELDSYLEEFFLTVKTRLGNDFSEQSLRRLRTTLSSYLRINNYPVNMLSSGLFAKSRVAYALKRGELLRAATFKTLAMKAARDGKVATFAPASGNASFSPPSGNASFSHRSTNASFASQSTNASFASPSTSVTVDVPETPQPLTSEDQNQESFEDTETY